MHVAEAAFEAGDRESARKFCRRAQKYGVSPHADVVAFANGKEDRVHVDKAEDAQRSPPGGQNTDFRCLGWQREGQCIIWFLYAVTRCLLPPFHLGC